MADHEKDLAKAADNYRKLIAARQALADAIAAAARDGVRQVDILRATGNIWTREQVRRISRNAGVEPHE